MTNEELMIEFQNGDDSALDKLYLKNQSFICSIAVDVATSFNCYKKQEASGKVTDYTKHILDELQDAKICYADECELYNMAQNADKIVSDALARKESIGAHYLVD